MPQSVDLIFDCVGGETAEEALGAIQQGGIVCTIAHFDLGDKANAAG